MTKAPDLQAALDAQIAAVEDEREPDGRIHPSSMWLCARQAVLAVRGEVPTNPPDALSLRRFRLGHMIHELVQSSLGRTEGVETVYVEVKVSTPEGIEGSADGLIVMTNGDAWVLEFKSAKAYALKKPPQDQHMQQGKTYAVALKLYGSESEDLVIPPIGDSMKGVLLVYVSKDDLTYVQHVLEYDKTWESEVADQVEYIEMYRETGLPPCYSQTKGGKWLRGYCPYKDNEDGCDAASRAAEEDYTW
jgi:hypothetical protein